jgi:hypothetical protein
MDVLSRFELFSSRKATEQAQNGAEEVEADGGGVG